MPEKICYCYDLMDDDIIADLQLHEGHSTILDKISKAKQAGECRCFEAHPEKR